MTLPVFICFLATILVLLGAILAKLDQRPSGRLFIYLLTLALFVFAGFRAQAINSDTRAYAGYALHFRHAGVSENPEITDRLEWGFRAFLRGLSYLFPEADDENYPLYANLTISVLAGLLLCRAIGAARGRTGLLLLIYMAAMFFAHQFAIIRLSLATILFLNYFIPSSVRGRTRLLGLAFLCAGCLIHYTILAMAVVLLTWETTLARIQRPRIELTAFIGLLGGAALLGVIAEYIAPLFLSGYHLSLVARAPGLALSPKGMVEVLFCTLLFLLHFGKIHWSPAPQHIRWRTLFYMTLTNFLLEVVSGLDFVGRFRILSCYLFLMQTVIITGGIDYRRKTTWLIFGISAAVIAAQLIRISQDPEWAILVRRP